MYQNRLILVTSIAKLSEYIIQPYHPDMAKPRALNTSLDGIAKIVIKTASEKQKILADLILRENKMQSSRGLDDEYEIDTSSQDNDECEASEVEIDEESEWEDENDGDSDEHSVDREETEDDCHARTALVPFGATCLL